MGISYLTPPRKPWFGNIWLGPLTSGGSFIWTGDGILHQGWCPDSYKRVTVYYRWWHIFRCSTTFWKLVEDNIDPVQVVHAILLVGHGIWVQSRSGVFVSYGLSSQPYLAQLFVFDYLWPIFSVGSSKPPIPKLANLCRKKQQIWTISNFALGVLLGFLLNRSPASDPTVDSNGIQCLVASTFFRHQVTEPLASLTERRLRRFSGAWSGLAPLTRHPSDPVEMIAWLSSSDYVFSLGREPCFWEFEMNLDVEKAQNQKKSADRLG